MSAFTLAKKENHYAKTHPKWGEDFDAGSGGKRFTGSGKGRTGESAKTWVSKLGLPGKKSTKTSATRKK